MRAALKALRTLAFVLLSGGASAGEDVRLRPNQVIVTEAVAPGKSVVLPFDAAPGDYLKGRVNVTAGSFDLEIVDANGISWRRLLDNVGLSGDFQFVARDTPSALRLVAGPGGGTGSLVLASHLPLAEQRAPVDGYASPVIASVAAELAAGGTTAEFWRRVETAGAPLVERTADGETLLTFVYRGADRNVRLVGAPSGDHEWLDRLDGSDIWFKSFRVPPETRFSYQLAPDVPDLPGSARERRVALLATAAADPLNKEPWPTDAPDRFNTKSTVTLPGAPVQPGMESAHAPTGEFIRFRLASDRLGNTRDVAIYRPKGFDPADRTTVLLVVFDGRNYQREVPTPAILDTLMADGRLPPTLAVFVDNPDQATRSRELPDNPDFASFLADDLLAEVRARTGFIPSSARTVLAGSSYGGLASLTVALRRPDAFGNALSLSGSYWWSPPDTPASISNVVAHRVATMERRPVRVFLSAGLFEREHGGADGILETNRHLRDVLMARGYQVTAREYAGGHDYFVWRGALADGLLALFGRGSTSNSKEKP
ncbi:enterochelin esterase [Pleomorphomonas sp. NRK KF1]|uniref:enterochelin esterase n=1 Tax=Pleomorphomonas sp. NRK KF1 TaxID=2943000 RepID=UPI00204330E4|nr:enterochelin esterase [Pleomorphomonas sp. NRK KF1]MCM5553414.1 enterochelin esterase [Pleomorphomonas sp. NRK KF1]